MSPLINRTVLLLSLAVAARAVNDDDIYGNPNDDDKFTIAIDPADYDCMKIGDIYDGGEALCGLEGDADDDSTAGKGMWGSSFYYERNESMAYTFWFNDMQNNPNDATTIERGLDVPNTCNVTYFHKSDPSPEPDDFIECHPWKENACCHQATVTTPDAINTAYGEGYRWDRCGKLSDACERFFVAEACFYECDVNLGHFRRFSDAEVASADDGSPAAWNTWQIQQMPVKASYCDSFYTACYHDYFHSSGAFWTGYDAFEVAYANATSKAAAAKAKAEGSSAPTMTANPTPTPTTATKPKPETPAFVVPVIIIAALLTVLGCGGALYMMMQEKAGKPVFMPLTDIATAPAPNGVTELTVANSDK